MSSCLAVLGDSDVPDASQGCRREEELLFFSSGLVSLPSLIFLRIPRPLAETSCTVSRKSRHPRHIRIKNTRTVFCYSQGQPDNNQDVPFMQKTTACLIWTQHATSSPSIQLQNKHESLGRVHQSINALQNLSALVMRKRSTVDCTLSDWAVKSTLD